MIASYIPKQFNNLDQLFTSAVNKYFTDVTDLDVVDVIVVEAIAINLRRNTILEYWPNSKSPQSEVRLKLTGLASDLF